MSVFDRITKEVKSGLELVTPYQEQPFTVKSIESDRIVFFIKTIADRSFKE